MVIGNEHEIVTVKFGPLTFKRIMKGAKTLWSIIKSCFGSGFWQDNSDWIDSDFWKD